MSKRLTHEEFVQRVDEINDNQNFTYLSEYINSDNCIYLQTEYGICKRFPRKLLRGNNCNITTALNKSLYFSNMCSNIHKGKYDYSKLYYALNKTTVTIICPIHGDFKQLPNNHLKGKGCRKCSDIEEGNKKRMGLEEFKIRSIDTHGILYNYDKAIYKDFRSKIKIGCEIHGYFNQAVSSHIAGSGCPKCGIKERTDKLRSNTKEFIEKADKVHNKLFTYKNTKYTTSSNKVVITCKIHGDFSQNPSSHLNGCGCRKCAIDFMITDTRSYSGWEDAGNTSNRFDSFKVYIIKCWNDEEEFYKIGKTFNTVVDRFRNPSVDCLLPYKWELVNKIEGSAESVSILEKKLQNDNISTKYKPKIDFQGMYECFSSINKETINYKWD